MATGCRIFGEAVAASRRRSAESRLHAAEQPTRSTGRGRRLTVADARRTPSGAAGAMTASKVASMRDAVAELVRDGDTVAIEGFTHLISFAAGHEIIRQRRRDLTLARMTPDVIYDQMIAAGVARKLVFSWLGNPGVGGLNAIRRRIEADPAPTLELEEYSHFGMVARYTAGAANLPFFPLRSYFETRPAEGQPADPARSRRPTATARSTRSRRSGRTSRSSTPSAPSPTATPRSGACSAARRRRRSPPTG